MGMLSLGENHIFHAALVLQCCLAPFCLFLRSLPHSALGLIDSSCIAKRQGCITLCFSIYLLGRDVVLDFVDVLSQSSFID